MLRKLPRDIPAGIASGVRKLPQDIPAGTTSKAEPAFRPRNPYKGLRPFGQEDAYDFFGRDQLVDELVNALEQILVHNEQEEATSRMLPVMGESGVGKSSAVLAGLLPRLRLGELMHSHDWLYLEPMRPGERAVHSLAVTLAHHLPGKKVIAVRKELEDEKALGFHHLATQIAATGKKKKVVLIVDQCEELFTQTIDQRERKQFVNLLLQASKAKSGPVLVILTLRSDLYDHSGRYAALDKIIDRQGKQVLSMSQNELRQAIVGPVMLPDVHVDFEDGLLDSILSNLEQRQDTLPLLQFALDCLFQKRNGRQLTTRAYEEIGKVHGALSQRARETYHALPTLEHQRLARTMFLRLVEPGMTLQDTTCRSVTLNELSRSILSKTHILQEVIDPFLNAHLLTVTDTPGAPSTIEIGHDALIREWPDLADWLEASNEDTLMQQTMNRYVIKQVE
jgi:hypothetical protein